MSHEQRSLSRRTFLKQTAAISAGLISARGIYALIDQFNPPSLARTAVTTSTTRPNEQYHIDDLEIVTDNNVPVVVPPLYHDVITATLTLNNPSATQLFEAQQHFEQALQYVEDQLPNTPLGLNIVVGWGWPYFRNYLPDALVQSMMPVDNVYSALTGKREFAKWLAEDVKIRELIEKKFASRPTINRIEIERSANLITITIHTAKAGVVIGRGGAGVTELKSQIEKIASLPVRINIEEVKRPELAAKLVAENIARQLERRINFRRATKSAAQATINAGAKGIRIEVAGRLNNAEMARREKVIEGSVPLHTLRADIDYHAARAQTPAGIIGVKVWIYKGERS